MLTEDRDLLTRFRAGDRAALAAVYRAYSPEIVKLVRTGFSFRSGTDVHRFYGHQQAFEQQDLVQEVFIRAFSESARMSYDGLNPYESYLKGILRNLVIDDARRRRAALKAFGGPGAPLEDPDLARSEADDPEVLAQRKRVKDAMTGFTETLPVREQRFVELRFVEGLGQEAVAKRLKISRQTVRTLEQRVRKRLHKHLRSRGVLDAGLSGSKAAAGTMPALLLPSVTTLFLSFCCLFGSGHA